MYSTRISRHSSDNKIPNHCVAAQIVCSHTTIATMTNLPLPNFPAHAANRSIYLGQIWQQIEMTEVASLLTAEGINAEGFKLYWDTRPPASGLHRGYCWVEFRTRELAVLAWARLNGLRKWNRTLVVKAVNKSGALQPSQDELNAARRPQPSGSTNPPPQAPSLPPRASSPSPRTLSPCAPSQDDALDRQKPWADLDEFCSNVIRVLKAQGIDCSPGSPTGDAPEGSSNADSN
ncbi:DnaJ domain-containing protein [Diaporthe amygdali]|uniref:DnaJ domain-containing protein n=1 Tax=Phomopsis amygdali TaxID=1214568 RepID=UPI0022FE0488|nr:DnaJ domain-containing protein [Diaporthe amygdali]KAJ0124618.1 DnaJ domain-containing protein [Diaporthe amygdali]